MEVSKYYRRKFLNLLKADLGTKATPISYKVFTNAVRRVEMTTGIEWRDIGAYDLTPGLPIYCDHCHRERDTVCGVCGADTYVDKEILNVKEYLCPGGTVRS